MHTPHLTLELKFQFHLHIENSLSACNNFLTDLMNKQLWSIYSVEKSVIFSLNLQNNTYFFLSII